MTKHSTKMASSGNMSLKIFIFLLALPLVRAAVTKLWVVYDDAEAIYQIKETQQADYVAVASLANTINETG